MAEQLAGLQRNENIRFFQFNVNTTTHNAYVNGLYMSDAILFDTGINLAGKKIFMWFIPDSLICWIVGEPNIDNTKVQVAFIRHSNAIITGKLNVMVVD